MKTYPIRMTCLVTAPDHVTEIEIANALRNGAPKAVEVLAVEFAPPLEAEPEAEDHTAEDRQAVDSFLKNLGGAL
jgi:hypothetical protein